MDIVNAVKKLQENPKARIFYRDGKKLFYLKTNKEGEVFVECSDRDEYEFVAEDVLRDWLMYE